MTTIRNLTPHAVTVAGRTFEPEGEPARVEYVEKSMDTIDGIPAVTLGLAAAPCRNVPAGREGVTLIVSRFTAAAMPWRSDLVFPDQEIRDDDGRIIGCQRLARFG